MHTRADFPVLKIDRNTRYHMTAVTLYENERSEFSHCRLLDCFWSFLVICPRANCRCALFNEQDSLNSLFIMEFPSSTRSIPSFIRFDAFSNCARNCWRFALHCSPIKIEVFCPTLDADCANSKSALAASPTLFRSIIFTFFTARFCSFNPSLVLTFTCTCSLLDMRLSVEILFASRAIRRRFRAFWLFVIFPMGAPSLLSILL